MTLAETPGVYYSFGYWLAVLVLLVRGPRRFSPPQTAAIAAGFLLAFEGWTYLTRDIPEMLFIPCVLVSVGLSYLFVWSTCRINAAQAGYYDVSALMLGEFAASLEYQIYYYTVAGGYLPDTLITNLICLFVVHAAVFGIAAAIWCGRLWRGGPLTVGRRELLTAICIGVFAYALSNVSYVLSDTPFSTSLSSELFIIRTLTDFGGLTVLFVYDAQLRERQLSVEQAMLRSMLRMQYNTYRISKESMDLVSRKYHDLKHQITLLRAESAGKNQYLDRMEREISEFKAQHHTGNEVLDTILNAKAIRCNRSGIDMTVIAQGDALRFLDPMDLCTLFGNALDNAIEAVERIPDVHRRMIRVIVAQQRSFTRILVENQYVGNIVFDDDTPRSTKGDPNNHGFGFKSIREIVRRYDGTVRVEASHGWFSLCVLMPAPVS